MIVWKLDELMRTRGIKGRELARRLDIGENYLSRVRHDLPERLSVALLDALCRELGCAVGDLLEYRATGRPRKARPLASVSDEALMAAVAQAFAQAEAEENETTEVDAPPTPVVGTAVLRTSALQAKLERLRRRRES